MIARALGCALLAPCFLFAGLQVYVLDGSSERPASGLVELGATDSGSTLEAVFRVRNTAGAADTLQSLTISGDRFSFTRVPATPASMAPGDSLDAAVRFQPLAPGSYSAVLAVNGQSVLLRAVAQAGAVVWLEQSGKTSALAPGTVTDFGTVESGSKATRRFQVANPGTAPLSLPVAVLGDMFHGPSGLPANVELGPGASLALEIAFEPQSVGTAQGAFSVAGRVYPLWGTGVALALPKPALVFQPSTVRSAQQAKLSIRLATAAQADARGTVRLDFTPASASVSDDPAVLFPATGSRAIEFSVSRGQDSARFNGQTETEFQTGTTAGSLTFTLEWAGEKATARLVVPAEPVGLDSSEVVRGSGRLELQLAGFDNSQSASQIGFAFFDREGKLVEPGRITLDASEDFRRYFQSSQLGGAFALHATIPVTGDSTQLAGLEVEIINSAGSARTGRIAF